MVSLIDRFTRDFQEEIGGKNLKEWADFLSNKDNTAFEVDHTGTLFKLYTLFSYAKWPYLKIMANQREKYKTQLIFLDLYCGNGLNKIATNNTFVCGSSILVLLASYIINNSRAYNGHFDHMVLIDKDKNSIEILEERCKTMLNELGIKTLDVGNSLSTNAKIILLKADVLDSSFIMDLSSWLRSLWTKNFIHTLLFIDPDRAGNFNMDILIQLLKFPGDLFILLHPGTFVEMVNKGRYNIETIQKMLAITHDEALNLFNIKKNKELTEFYLKRFENVITTTTIDHLRSGSNRRDVIITIPITTGTNTNYYLLYATRKTAGGESEKWQKVFGSFANEVGRMSEVGKSALAVLEGPQKTMDEF